MQHNRFSIIIHLIKVKTNMTYLLPSHGDNIICMRKALIIVISLRCKLWCCVTVLVQHTGIQKHDFETGVAKMNVFTEIRPGENREISP